MPSPNGNIPLNHGGHEVFDLHECLASTITLLDSYQLYRPHIQCQELLGILDRQYQFTAEEYNQLVDVFSRGSIPNIPHKKYLLPQPIQNTYGIVKQGAPAKPNKDLSQLSDRGLSAYMLGQMKSNATLRMMSALEVTNPNVRKALINGSVNCAEQAYELYGYMNERQYYQVPRLDQQDMEYMLTSYEATSWLQMPPPPSNAPPNNPSTMNQ